jgi:hypothetical protein
MKVKKILDKTLIITVLLALILPVSLNALPMSQIMSAATDADDGPYRRLDFDDDTRMFLGVTDAPPTGASYMLCEHWGGNWSDAEKTPQNTEDDLMCWAACASNVLEWTGWGLAGGMWNTDQMFQYFQDHWTDAGGLQIYGWDWWFDGTNPSQGWPGWSQVDVPGGNFWPSHTFSDYYHEDWDDPDALSAIDSYLHSGYGVGLAIYTDTGGGHAITVWGYNYNPSNPTDYYGVWVSDSDDYKSWTNPPDKIRYYEVSYSGGRWYLQNYYGTNLWYIGGVMAMEPFPSNRPVADAGGPYTGYVGSPVTFDASGSTDADGDPLQYRWDFDRDNDWDTSWSTSPTATHTWSVEHTGTVALQVYDGHMLDVDIATVTVSALEINIYTDKTAYTEGDTMHLGLDIVNTGPAENVCLGIWLKRPDTSTVIITHVHDITLPHGLDYSNPSFRSFILPNIPSGVYTWHAALLNPPTHDVLLKDTAEWELLTR